MSVAPSLNISGYNWRNGFENNNIWVIYSDTFSQGQSTAGNSVPTIWGTPQFTEAGLLNLINVLPARAGLTAFTVLSDAIAWLYGEGKYFLSNQNYPQIVTENLLAFWDAGFSASYPNLGTTFYNLSTTGNGTLTNGPTWTNNNTKSYFNFDGTDDVVVATGVNLQQNFTLEAWINMTTRTNFGIFSKKSKAHYFSFFSGQEWHHPVLRILDTFSRYSSSSNSFEIHMGKDISDS
jgi:hypothetical protein